ncbi:hypothetical protein H2203_005644 [Taxawa tesnikishii (nom. ined.)]|nr:hypothetical protein H2203_005644 [Dothideales sp. JES 119]
MLEKRANIYSSRPPLVMLGDSRGATEYDQAVLAYGDVWRQHRRLMHTAVGTQAVRAYRPLQDKEIKVMMRDLLSQPDNFVKAIERYSVSVVSCIGFGRRIDKMDDNVGQVALKFMEGVDLVIPGMFLMESMPILLQLPRMIYPLSAKSLGNGKKMIQFFSALCKEAGMSTQDNFAKGLLRAQQQNGLRDEEIAFLTGNLIGGGVDTTASTTITFIFAMCVFSDVQKKAQEELDRVVGDRMPDWQDEARLSYIRALVDETLRWRTVTILGGIPHANTEEDVFGDYVIPKDTWIAGNIWSIHRNPTDFPEPDIFRPERFLNEKKPFPSKKGHAAFGWGRRACSGQPLAEQGLFMTFARLLWAFDLRPGLDENGIEQKLDIFAFTESENMRPEPFRVRISPRTEQKKALILEEAAHARDQLREFDGITKVELEPLEI